MSQLTRAPSRSSRARSRLLLVRPPAKSVRREDQADPLAMQLTIGIVVAVGIVAVVWIIGHIGFRLGFAPLVRVPELAGEPGSGLVTGTMMIISVPRVIFQAGLGQPMWLMAAFALIAIPAAGLAAARPAVPGGPQPNTGLVIMANAGAVLSMVSGALLIWWTGSPLRAGLMRELPTRAVDAGQWSSDLHVVAGVDVLAVVCASAWIVLVLRLPIATWLRAIAASAAFFTLVVVTVAMAMSNAGSAQLGMLRSLAVTTDGSATPQLILGHTPHHTASLIVEDETALVELWSRPEPITVTGRLSVTDYLQQYAPAEPQ